VLCIIQARCSSKRLPGKVLKKISGLSILERVFNQVKKSKKIKRIIIATSNHKTDKKIIKFCKIKNINCFVGPLNDVFKRFYLIAKNQNYKSFVRVSADSPFVDPKLIDRAVTIYNKKNYDIVTNIFPRTFPKGFSVEVIRSKIILNSITKIKKKIHKEHLTSYFYKNYKKYKIKNLSNNVNYNNLNFSIDSKDDFIKAKKIIKIIRNKDFTLNDILKVSQKLI
jgi:spore coat polysaccharide biosynthesis protein SpsF